MTIEFHCPHCDKTLKTSDEKAGRQAKCPGCGELISVPFLEGAAVEAPVIEGEEVAEMAEADDGTPSPSGRSAETRPCPTCGEIIKAAAIRCRFCGEDLEEPGEKRRRERGQREMRPFPPGEVISESWRIFTERLGILIGSYLLMVLIILIPVIFAVILFVIGGTMMDQNNEAGGILAFCGGGVFVLVAVGVSLYLQGGYFQMQIKAAREETIVLADLFGGGRFALRLFVSSLVFGMMVGLGYLACIVPGVLLTLMFFLYAYVIVDDDASITDCFTRSKNLTKDNWGSIFLIFLFGMVCSVIGQITYIGSIFVAPFLSLVWAVAYDRMTFQTPLDQIGQD